VSSESGEKLKPNHFFYGQILGQDFIGSTHFQKPKAAIGLQEIRRAGVFGPDNSIPANSVRDNFLKQIVESIEKYNKQHRLDFMEI